MAILRIYTDGACSRQPIRSEYRWLGRDPRVWRTPKGTVRRTGQHDQQPHGIRLRSSAFKALKQADQKIEVFIDSSMVANCFREEWYVSWERTIGATPPKICGESRAMERAAMRRCGDTRCAFPCPKARQPASKSTNFDAFYEKFLGWNGARLQLRGFQYVTKMNNRRRGAHEHQASSRSVRRKIPRSGCSKATKQGKCQIQNATQKIPDHT